MNVRHLAGLRRAFSLMELLAVIAIIALIVALVVPALGKARTAARRAETGTLCNDILQACLLFQQDHNRLPGAFSAREMGSAQNATRGFTAMQNVMLDLSGGVLEQGAPAQAGDLQVGPTAANTLTVRPSLMGQAAAGSKLYYIPSGKYFKPSGLGGESSDGVGRATGAGYAWASNASDAEAHYYEMRDAFNNPLTIWTLDEQTRGDVSGLPGSSSGATFDTFAQIDYAGRGSRFYWNSNAAYYSNTIWTYPTKFRHDVAANFTVPQSMLGRQVPAAQRAASLGGLLGNPASPMALTVGAAAMPCSDIMPSAARGSVVIHSGGPDRVLLFSDKQIGASRALKAGGLSSLFYGLNFRPSSAGGDSTTVLNPSTDVMSEFDDLVVAGG